MSNQKQGSEAPTNDVEAQATTEANAEAEQVVVEEVRNATREEVDESSYWNQVYAESEDNSPGWNLGEANPEFPFRLANDKPEIAPGKALIVGCGYGHDALAFAQAGFDVTALDFAPMAIAGAKKSFEAAGASATFLQTSLFDLGRDHDGKYDYIVEHTCFCAIHPERRAEYAKLVARLLKPSGQLIGLFYHHGREGGPPWNVTPEEVRATFEPYFDVRTLTIAQHSVERREGKELWARFWRKA